MIDSLFGVLTIGFLLGAPAGITPGPMLVLIISETFRHGIRAGAKVAFIPLLTDLPVVLGFRIFICKALKCGFSARRNFTVRRSFSHIPGQQKYQNRQRRNSGFYSQTSPFA